MEFIIDFRGGAMQKIILATLIIIFVTSCSSPTQDKQLSNTQTAIVLSFTKSAFDLSTTETAMYLKVTQADKNRRASETARPTNTPIPSNTPIPPTSTPSSTPLPTSTVTPIFIPAETSTQTPLAIIPTYTSTPVKGMAKVRIENRTDYDLTLSLRCLQGPCTKHSPQTYRFVHPPGIWFIYIWDGKYEWKYHFCGDKYEEWVHTINTTWSFYLPARACRD